MRDSKRIIKVSDGTTLPLATNNSKKKKIIIIIKSSSSYLTQQSLNAQVHFRSGRFVLVLDKTHRLMQIYARVSRCRAGILNVYRYYYSF